jgi:hypothetical protein
MKKPFLKNLFGKKRNELVEKLLFDKQVNESRKILVIEAIYDRFQHNEVIPLDWVLEYNELIRKSSSSSYKTINVESEIEKVITEPKSKVEFVKINELSKDFLEPIFNSLPIKEANEPTLNPIFISKKERKTRTRYTIKQINKAFREVIKEVEQGVSVTQAIENRGFSKGTFYQKISPSQKMKLKRTRLRANATK